MTIKSITTKHVTESTLGGITEPETETEFVPYYQCKIVTDSGNASAKGDTPEQAEQNALDLLKLRATINVDKAFSEYLSAQGIHFVDA
jgi:hypothetical protein